MRRFAKVCGTLLWAALSASQAGTQEQPAVLPASCITEQTASIHVPLFALAGKDPSLLKTQFDGDIKAIQSLSARIGVTKMVAGGMSYTISPQQGMATAYDGPLCEDCLERRGQLQQGSAPVSYQLNGNVNFLLEPSSKGIQLLNLLLTKNYPATLSFVEVNKKAGLCQLNVSTGGWE